jgi:hypothetical protein
MRETALMDHLHGHGGGREWAPSAEQVLAPSQLVAAGEGAPPAADDPRPPGFGPPRRRVDSAGAAPVPLTADDLEALEALSPGAFAAGPRPAPPPGGASGPAAPAAGAAAGGRAAPAAAVVGRAAPPVAPVGPAVGAGAPWPAGGEPALTETIRIAPAAPRRRARAEAAEPATAALPVWPPPGAVTPPAPTADGRPARSLGPVPSRNRPDPRRRRRRRVAAGLGVLVIGAGAAVGLSLRQHGPGTPTTWDGRIVPLASFVAHARGLPWRHPVRVDFLTASDFAARFESPAEVPPAAQPVGVVGTKMARWDPSHQTVYVNGATLSILGRVAVVGDLDQALEAQYSATAGATEAVRVQAAYVHTLTAADQQELRRQERS